MLKIRLSRTGRKKEAHFSLKVADSKSPRDGKFIEKIGHYHPCSKDKKNAIYVNIERLNYWISKGAQPTESMKKRINSYLKNNEKSELFLLFKESQNIGISKKQRKDHAKEMQKKKEEYIKNKQENAKKAEEAKKEQTVENKTNE